MPPSRKFDEKFGDDTWRLQRTATAAPMAEPVAVKTSYRQGDRCLVSGTKPGTIQFVGPLPALGSGLWVGVFHDDAVGNTNGRVNGRRIFDCPLKHGGFYHANDVDVQSAIAAPVFSTPAPAAEGPTSAGPKGRWAQVRDQASALVELGSVSASASTSVAAGRGLSTAIVNQVSQVLITCHDANGLRREAGGDLVSVAVRGVSPPSKLRVKIHDHSNGQYIAEYKAELTGQLLVHISINGYALAHSPFAVTAVTLRADPVRCALRGEALTSAIARRSMTFEIDFVDGLGQVAVAEDVDVRLERFEPLPAEEVTAKRAKVEAQRPAARVAQRPGARVAARRMRAAARWQRNRVRRIRRSLCKMRTKTRSSRRGLRARVSCECSSAKG